MEGGREWAEWGGETERGRGRKSSGGDRERESVETGRGRA